MCSTRKYLTMRTDNNLFGVTMKTVSCLFGLFLVVSLSLTMTTTADEPRPAVEAEMFPIPDGTIEELFTFINTVKMTPPEERTQEAVVAHLKAQVKAVVAVCDRILKLNPDEPQQLKVLMERLSGYSVLSQVDESAAKRLNALFKQYENDERPAVVQLIGGLRLQTHQPATGRNILTAAP